MSPPFFRDGGVGYWGHPTSTMDWCEENYISSYYLAEFWNSISNIIFLVLPLTCLYYSKNKLEIRYHLDLSFLAAIGIGSFAFHSTLLYHSQLLDELPMIYGTCTMLYCVIEVESKENKLNIYTASICTFVSLFITWVYIYGKDPMIFLICYSILATLLLALHIQKCIKHNGDRSLLAWGTASYMLGFTFWMIDNEMCSHMRTTRDALPDFLRPFAQFHALWHFFAGIGTYLSISFSINLRIRCLGYEPSKRLVCGILPYYVKGAAILEYQTCKTEEQASAVTQLDVNGNVSKSKKLKSRKNGSIGNFSRLL